MDQPQLTPHLQRLIETFEDLPECAFKATMRGMIYALPDVLDRRDVAGFTIGRLQKTIARWRRQDPLTRFDAELRGFERRVKRAAAAEAARSEAEA